MIANTVGFEHFFTATVISLMVHYKKWAGGGLGWVGSQRWVISSISTQRAVLCLQSVTETESIHRIS